jgi:hypothetical protein
VIINDNKKLFYSQNKPFYHVEKFQKQKTIVLYNIYVRKIFTSILTKIKSINHKQLQSFVFKVATDFYVYLLQLNFKIVLCITWYYVKKQYFW